MSRSILNTPSELRLKGKQIIIIAIAIFHNLEILEKFFKLVSVTEMEF